jgi:hypothetical protein
MKLIQELLILREEAIEMKLASDLWKESKDAVKTYVTNATYLARKVKDSDPVKYEVFQDINSKRKLIGKFESDEFDAAYVPVRANQPEDAEGYKTYRDSEEIEAFKYEGDTIKVDLEGETGKLKTGDYLIRSSEGDNFTYSIETSKYFETDYAEKK